MNSFFQNKKCLVTGGAGFIGSNLALKLVELGSQVSIIDSLHPDCGGNLYNLKSIENRIQFQNLDLSEVSKNPTLISDVDFIFNLAGNVSHQDSMNNPLQDLELNSRAHLQLLETCRKHNPGVRIVYASTRQLYGVPQYLPVDEKHPINAVDVNGVNKFAGEQFHLLYARAYGLKATALRLTNTFGPRQLIRHARQGFIGWFVNRVVTHNPIQVFGDGTQIRDFNEVDDVAEALLLSVQNDKCIGEAFNLSGPRADLKTIAEALVEISEKSRVELIPFPAERKRIDIGDYYGTSDKFRNITGWKPKTNLKEGLTRMVHYYFENQSHYL